MTTDVLAKVDKLERAARGTELMELKVMLVAWELTTVEQVVAYIDWRLKELQP